MADRASASKERRSPSGPSRDYHDLDPETAARLRALDAKVWAEAERRGLKLRDLGATRIPVY
ncbi:MAG: hypothetical protein KY455_06570 [Euryarchaeota archaeon]|nr:hypothetical protein [Euryarchaeota archaeon]